MNNAVEAIQEQGAEEATHVEDAVEEVAEEHPQKSNRDKIYDEIVAKRKEELSGPVEEPEEEPEDVMVDLKVDGEIVQKLQSEIDQSGGVAEMQKILSANKRMEEAATERKRVEQMQRDLAVREQKIKQQEELMAQRLAEKEAEPENDAEIDSLAERFIESVYSGEEKNAKESFREILKKNKGKTIINNQSEKTVDEAAILEKAIYEIDKREGLKAFNKDYAHLKQDTNLYNMTNDKTVELMEKNPEWTPSEVILEAAKQVDAWHQSISGKPADSQLDDRAEDKRNLGTLKQAQSRSKVETGYKPKTKEDIFMAMKKSRAK